MEPMSFILFGATGDLAKRKIYPALYNLFLEKKLPSTFSVVGLGRREWSDTVFQQHVKDSLMAFSRTTLVEDTAFNQFLSQFTYSVLNVDQPKDYQTLLQKLTALPENRLFYLSVSPEFFEVIGKNIKESGLSNTTGWKRLIIEKPFGRDLTSAQELNQKLSSYFTEDEVYRIDHYLGKGMVQNLGNIRFSNPLLNSVWNKNMISNIQITASETVGVEERAAYYDHSGAIRDMIQNHMLQMLMMVAMKAPSNGSTIRDEKKKILDALRVYGEEEVENHVVRAQYEGYLQEPGVSETSTTDTFIAIRAFIDNDDWEGVPFYIRTGKKMAKKSTKITVEFKKNTSTALSNVLTFEINPTEGVSILLNGKEHPMLLKSQQTTNETPEAYERLIGDAIRGDASFFARWDEVELSWKFVQPILHAFEKGLPVHSYEKGSNGPRAAHELVKEYGYTWL